MTVDTDEALRLLGRYSKWQLIHYAVYSLGYGVPYAWMLMSVVFLGKHSHTIVCILLCIYMCI